jgi:hypothetical protein
LSISATHVLTEHFDTAHKEWQIELIELETDQRRVIAEHSGLIRFQTASPLLHDGQVYWLDPVDDLLVIYDIDSEGRRTVPLPVANEPIASE